MTENDLNLFIVMYLIILFFSNIVSSFLIKGKKDELTNPFLFQKMYQNEFEILINQMKFPITNIHLMNYFTLDFQNFSSNKPFENFIN